MGTDPANENLKGKVAIVTGASAGIGRSISLALGKAGVRLVLAARREKELEETANRVRDLGGEAQVIPTDVTQDAALQKLVQGTVDQWEGLHILINNAGTYHRGTVEELGTEELERTLRINLVAPMILTKYALPHLRKNPGSAVINIASIAATMGFAKGAAYSASKFGILGFSESLFEEVREFGVKVCAICPGFVATPMVAGHGLAEDRLIRPEDVAQSVLGVLAMSAQSCPTRLIIRPQYSPYREGP